MNLPPPPPPSGQTPASQPPAFPPVPQHAARWEPITPNIQITDTHLSAFGAVMPLAGTEWHATTSGSTTRTIPPWAIVLCVLFIWACFLGLLFLAVKEERFAGEVTVTARSRNGKAWSESVPVSNLTARDGTLARVAWAQTMTSRADFSTPG